MVGTSSFTLMRMMLGELDTMTSLTTTHFIEANAYFFLFAVVVTIILLNLFIGIVSEFFALEHEKSAREEAESRRRDCLFPQFDLVPFTLLLRMFRQILTEHNASICTRLQVLALTLVGACHCWPVCRSSTTNSERNMQ